MYVYIYIYIYIHIYTYIYMMITAWGPRGDSLGGVLWGVLNREEQVDALSLLKHFHHFFLTFSLCLFGMTLFDDFHHFLMTCSFFCRSPKSHTITFFIRRFSPRPHIEIYSGGRQTHVFWRFRGVDLREDAWRRS